MLWKVYRNFDDLNRDLNRPKFNSLYGRKGKVAVKME